MLADKEMNQWQIKTVEGVFYEPDSLDSLIQWIIEGRIGSNDQVFSPGKKDWVKIYEESSLENCFWKVYVSDKKIYGPISLGELKQLFLNRQINEETKVSPYKVSGGFVAVKDVYSLNRFLEHEFEMILDYKVFLDKLADTFLQKEAASPGQDRKLQKKVDELRQKINEKEINITNLETECRRLQTELKSERDTIEKIRISYEQKGSEQQGLFQEINDLKAQIKEKQLLIDEVNKQLAEMEVDRTIKDGEINDLKEKIELIGSGDVLLQLNIQEKQFEEERESLLASKNNLEKNISRLQNEKDGLQEFLGAMQKDLDTVKDEKEELLNKVVAQEETLRISNDRVQDAISKKDAIIKSVLENRDLILKELQLKNEKLEETERHIESSIHSHKSEGEYFNRQLKDLAEELSQREGVINGLEDQISKLEVDYRLKIDELNDLIQKKENHFSSELNKKAAEAASSFNDEKAELLKMQKFLESRLSEKNRDLESLLFEKESLVSELAGKDNEWQKRLSQKLDELRSEKSGVADSLLLDEKERLEKELRDLNGLVSEKTAEAESLAGIKTELENKLKVQNEEWEKRLSEKVEEFKTELGRKDGALESSLVEERERLEKTQRELENKLTEKISEISILAGDKERIEKQAASMDEEWGKRLLLKTEEFKREIEKVRESLDAEFGVEKERFSEISTNLRVKLNERDLEIETLGSEIEGLEQEAVLKGAELERISAEKDAKIETLILDNSRLQKEWEAKLDAGRKEMNNLYESKKTEWENTLKSEQKRIEGIQLELEAELCKAKADIDRYAKDNSKFKSEIESQARQWETKLVRIEEDSRNRYDALLREKEALQSDFKLKIESMETDTDRLRAEMENRVLENEGLGRNNRTLQQELTNKERFIEEIKRKAEQIEQVMGEKEREYNKAIEDLNRSIRDISGRLESERITQDGLRNEITELGDELNRNKQIAEDIKAESLRLKEEYRLKQEQTEKQLTDAKEELEKAVEENRAAQKQFYLEKQKLTKDYTETINRQSKIEKRNQLEREISDRTVVKDDLSRLYDALKDSLDGIQKGSAEIQTSLDRMQDDIEKKKLSLKYISESEKRDEKKGQFAKGDINRQGNGFIDEEK